MSRFDDEEREEEEREMETGMETFSEENKKEEIFKQPSLLSYKKMKEGAFHSKKEMEELSQLLNTFLPFSQKKENKNASKVFLIKFYDSDSEKIKMNQMIEVIGTFSFLEFLFFF